MTSTMSNAALTALIVALHPVIRTIALNVIAKVFLITKYHSIKTFLIWENKVPDHHAPGFGDPGRFHMRETAKIIRICLVKDFVKLFKIQAHSEKFYIHYFKCGTLWKNTKKQCIVKLVSWELYWFGVIARLFWQIGGHNSRFVASKVCLQMNVPL